MAENKDSTFEQDIERIEKLLVDMRDSDLNKTVDTYIEAKKLIEKCQKKLSSYRAKLEQISAAKYDDEDQ